MSWLLRVGVLLMGLLKQAGLVSTAEAGMPTTAREPVRNRTRESATPWRACALHVPPGTDHALEHVLELRPEKKNTRSLFPFSAPEVQTFSWRFLRPARRLQHSKVVARACAS